MGLGRGWDSGQVKREAWCREAQDTGLMASSQEALERRRAAKEAGEPWTPGGSAWRPSLRWLQAPPGPALCTLPKPSCWGGGSGLS